VVAGDLGKVKGDEMWPVIVEKVWGEGGKNGKSTTIDVAFCPGSKLSFVPVFKLGLGFWDKSLEALVSGGRTGTKCP